jgi:type II secretory pathway pseudopilin PulG
MALFNRQSSGADRGFSLVESLVLIGLLTFLFTGIFYGFQATLVLIAENRAQVTALSLVTDRLESIRSLSYVAVGTDGGIPAGAIPQTSTTTANGIEFTERVLVEYVDDPADGVGVSDANGITTDYKRVRVSYTWNQFNSPREVVLASNIIPRSIESDVGGGTLRVNVFDAAIQPVSGAEVQVTNTTVSPAVSVVRYTNSEGVALIGGAPAASEYELLVTDTNYSTDQTHQATTTLPNPDKSPVTVVEADVTTMNFFIDDLSDLGDSEDEIEENLASVTVGAAAAAKAHVDLKQMVKEQLGDEALKEAEDAAAQTEVSVVAPPAENAEEADAAALEAAKKAPTTEEDPDVDEAALPDDVKQEDLDNLLNKEADEAVEKSEGNDDDDDVEEGLHQVVEDALAGVGADMASDDEEDNENDEDGSELRDASTRDESTKVRSIYEV